MKYQCIELSEITEDIARIRFAPVDSVLKHLSGQYVLARFNQNQKIALSIANEPNQGELEFHLRHNDEQPIAQLFLKHLQNNKTIEMNGPYGNTTLSAIVPQKHVAFIAGGTGFAPFQALIPSLLKTNPHNQVHLFWGIRKPQDAYAITILTKWQEKYSQFNYSIIISEPEFYPLFDANGWVHEFVSNKINDFENYQVIASGPIAMIQAAKQLFVQRGLSSTNFITDMALP